MPEVTPEVPQPAPPPPPPDAQPASAGFEEFTCADCRMKISDEPKCPDCAKCVACCECVHCDACGHRATSTCPTCRMCKGGEHPCCRCWKCERCSRPISGSKPPCSACGYCKVNGCCRCWTCGRCGVVHGRHNGLQPCPSCSQCMDCCNCQTIRHLNPAKPTFHVVPVGETDTRAADARTVPPVAYRVNNRSTRFLASEIEVSGVRNRSNTMTARVVRKWGGAIVTDGSLGSGGFEINTAPAAGDVFGVQIAEVCEALRADQAFCTTNAGAHLHIDARDFSFYDMRRLIFLYQKLEDGIYGLAAPHRHDNHFCSPCGGHFAKALKTGALSKDNKRQFLKALYQQEPNRDTAQLKRDKAGGGTSRYLGFNLHSWMFRGTVECRILHGTTDPVKLTNWGSMWASILDYAMKSTEANIAKLSGPPIELLLNIAPTEELKQWIENRWAFFHRNRR